MKVIRHEHVPSDCNVVLSSALALTVSRKCVVGGAQFTNWCSIESATGNIEDGLPNVEEVESPRPVLDHIPTLEMDALRSNPFANATAKKLHAARVPPQQADSESGFYFD